MTVRRRTGQVDRGVGKVLASVESVGAGRNWIINGCMRVAQRGTAYISTGTYQNDDDQHTLDRWNLLSDGDDRADITQETTVVPDGSYAAMKFDVETITAAPNSEKFGLAQCLEARDTAPLWKNATGIVSVQFKARTTTLEVENVRCAVLAWDGAADAPTHPVNAWGAEGTNPTWAANWTAENTPANLALTNVYQTFTVENVALDTAGTTNLAVFIWVDDKDLAVADVLYVTDVQLEEGRFATPFERRDFGTELALCQRYYYKTFPYGTTPVQTGGSTGSLRTVVPAAGANGGGVMVHYPTRMRTAPSITTFNPQAADALWDGIGVADVAADMLNGSDQCGYLAVNDVGCVDQGEYRIHIAAGAEVW